MSRRLGKAIALTAWAFRDDVDKGGEAYIMHCIRVMMRLRSDLDCLNIPAICHDLIEDHPELKGDIEKLELTQGELYTLDCLTHREGESYEDYIERICTDKWAIMIKISDLRDNSDILRLKGVRKKDLLRIEKYHCAYLRLEEALKSYE